MSLVKILPYRNLTLAQKGKLYKNNLLLHLFFFAVKKLASV